MTEVWSQYYKYMNAIRTPHCCVLDVCLQLLSTLYRSYYWDILRSVSACPVSELETLAVLGSTSLPLWYRPPRVQSMPLPCSRCLQMLLQTRLRNSR